jgi:hypothetical protein
VTVICFIVMTQQSHPIMLLSHNHWAHNDVIIVKKHYTVNAMVI